MTMKVGIEGRIITGPAGAPGNVDVPLRIAVVQESGVSNPKAIVSKFERQTVTINNAVDRVTFTQIDPDDSRSRCRSRSPTSRQYVVYVGFDPSGAQPAKEEAGGASKPRRHCGPRARRARADEPCRPARMRRAAGRGGGCGHMRWRSPFRGDEDRKLLRRRHPQHAPLRQQRAQRRRLDRLVQHLDALRARLLRAQLGERSAVIRIAGSSPQRPAQAPAMASMPLPWSRW